MGVKRQLRRISGAFEEVFTQKMEWRLLGRGSLRMRGEGMRIDRLDIGSVNEDLSASGDRTQAPLSRHSFWEAGCGVMGVYRESRLYTGRSRTWTYSWNHCKSPLQDNGGQQSGSTAGSGAMGQGQARNGAKGTLRIAWWRSTARHEMGKVEHRGIRNRLQSPNWTVDGRIEWGRN